jgi:drug/metabolite transporter (DMT)-like permease
MKSRIAQSPLMLIVVPLLTGSVPFLLFHQRLSWWQAAPRLGAIGLGFSAWVDLLDNCGIECVENDPLLLSAAWALSGTLLAAGAGVLVARATAQRRRPTH